MKKAFLIIPHWSDDQSVYSNKQHRQPEYADTASKAKYSYYLHLEMDEDDWFKYRSLRWPEMDLFPPVLDPILNEIPESALKKLKHTYGAESREPGFRNYYNGSVDDPDFKILIEKTLAVRNTSRDNMLSKGTTYYHLTNKGIDVVMTTREILREVKS